MSLSAKEKARELSIADHRHAMSRGALCLQCPLFGSRRGPVDSFVRPNSKLVIVSETPSLQAIREGRPFAGKLEQEVETAMLEVSGGTLISSSFVNVVECGAPKGFPLKEYEDRIRASNRVKEAKRSNNNPIKTTPLPSQCCAPRLQHDIKAASAKTLLSVGPIAFAETARILGFNVGKKKGSKLSVNAVPALGVQSGHPVETPKLTWIPTQDPVSAPRKNRAVTKHVRDAFLLAYRSALRGSVGYRESIGILAPSAKDIVDWMGRMQRVRPPFLTIDIETGPRPGHPKEDAFTLDALIRCIGVGAYVRPEDLGRPVRVQLPCPACGTPLSHDKKATKHTCVCGHEWVPLESMMRSSMFETVGVRPGERPDCGRKVNDVWYVEDVIVVPWYTKAGKKIFSSEERFRVQSACYEAFSSIPVDQHNALFDEPILRHQKWRSKKAPWPYDTMLAHKNSFWGDAPHKLDFCSIQYNPGVPLWKFDVDHKGAADE